MKDKENIIPGDKTEGPVAHLIESNTAKLPSDVFLWAGLGAMAASVALESTGRHRESQQVANWAPVVLILGLYNKLVKIAGHDYKNPV